MKKIYFLILLCNITYSSFSQLPNGGFEDWTFDSTAGFLKPDGWATFTGVNDSNGVLRAVGHTGLYCVHLKSTQRLTLDYGGASVFVYDLPLNAYPEYIKGWWRVQNALLVDDILFSWYIYDSLGTVLVDNTSSSGFGIDFPWTNFSYGFGLHPVAGYYNMTLSFNLPDSPTSPTLFGEIDDLELNFFPNGVPEVDLAITQFTIEPTISTGNFNLKLSATRKNNLTFNIYDLTGRSVAKIENKAISFGNHSLPFDLNLPDGIYILKMKCDQGEKSTKFIISN
jgi:hypothetical protein